MTMLKAKDDAAKEMIKLANIIDRCAVKIIKNFEIAHPAREKGLDYHLRKIKKNCGWGVLVETEKAAIDRDAIKEVLDLVSKLDTDH